MTLQIVIIETEVNKKIINNPSNSRKKKEERIIVIHGDNMIKHLKG